MNVIRNTVITSVGYELVNGKICISFMISILAPWRPPAHSWNLLNTFIFMNKWMNKRMSDFTLLGVSTLA